MARETIVLGGGCFWCLEAMFVEIDGVLQVQSGYAGGTSPAPDYESICSGTTGHAEVVRILFDDERLALADLLAIFFGVHDPTTVNRQGHDVGSQYRSIILVADGTQAATARAVVDELAARQVFDDPIVTEIAPLGHFHPAEAFHHRYFERHPEQGYCRTVISPKVTAFRREFATHCSATLKA